MSSLYNRMYDEGLGLLGPRKQHRIRSRRLSGPSKHHRTDMATSEPEFPSRLHGQPSSFSEDVSSLAQAHVGIESTAAFAGCHSQQLHQQQDQEYEFLPLPPVVLRMDMPGSPFSLYPPNNDLEFESEHGPLRPITRSAHLFGSARAMGAGGRSGVSGGGGRDGDNPVPSEGVNGGGDDGGAEGGESEGGKSVPSAYTFRRRNAIVEGSEEAPKSDDFPDSA
ncbi:hypothetical protein BGX26_009794 [Mortierella sp. AD094]|nr:hypothetical protein BGX26_009794 [Mortierella sp. AD094]